MPIRFLDEDAAASPEQSSSIRFLDQIPVGSDVAPPAKPVASPTERMFSNFISGLAAVPALALPARGAQMLASGTRAAPYANAAANLFVPKSGADLTRQTALSAGTAVGAGEIGQAVAEKAGEDYRLPAEIVGGLGLALPANSLLTAAEVGVKGVVNRATGKDFFDFGTKAATTFGAARAEARLRTAMQSNPDLPGDLARASEIEKMTGVNLPITAASKGDTTITGMLASQTSRGENAAFTAVIKQQEKDALKAIKEAQNKLAGDPRNAALVAEVEAKKITYENTKRETAYAMKQANIERQLGGIETRIQELTSDGLMVTAGKEDLGNRVTNLLSSRESVLRGEFKPLYEEVLQNASKQGIEMESPVVASLWNFVKQRQSEDVFNKFPALDSAIKRVLAPTKVPVSSSFATKYPNLVKSAEGTFKPMDVNSIDSLKRGINRAIGDTQDKDQLRMLYELKNRFDEALTSLPEDFVTSYKGLDKQYAEKLGIFSEAGIVSVDRARFVESTVPLLTSKPSAIRQILTATDNSPEALKIIEDAFLMKISQTNGIVNTNTMSVNPAALQSFLRKNTEAIDQVPGLRDRLEGLSSNVDGLLSNRERLLDMQKNAAIGKLESVWSKAYGQTGGFEGFVNRSLNNPEELKQLMAAAGSDVTLQRGLKSVVLDLGLKSTNKIKFFDDNKQTINVLFGKDHSENIKALLEASERLAKNPVMANINQSLTQVTRAEQLTGLDPVKTASLLRQQVQSTFYKVSTILSKFLQNKSMKSENTEIQEFLSNGKNVRDMAAAMKALETETQGGVEKAKQLAGKLLSNASIAALIGASAPARIIERGEVPNQEEETQ